MDFEHALKQAVRVWRRRDLAPKTIQVYCTNLRRLNRRLLLCDPGIQDRVETWQDRHRGTAAEINGDLSAMRSFYGALGVDDPTAQLSRARVPIRPPRPLSVEQTKRLFAVPMTLRDRVLLECMYPHGMRISEARTLMTDQLSWVDGRMRVEVHGKGRRNRTLLLKPNTSARMARLVYGVVPQAVIHIDPAIPVFLWQGTDGKIRMLPEREANRIFHSIIEHAGLKAVMHQLRHTTLTRMVEADVPILKVMAVSGHSKPDQLMQYVKLTGAAQAVDAIADAD